VRHWKFGGIKISLFTILKQLFINYYINENYTFWVLQTPKIIKSLITIFKNYKIYNYDLFIYINNIIIIIIIAYYKDIIVIVWMHITTKMYFTGLHKYIYCTQSKIIIINIVLLLWIW